MSEPNLILLLTIAGGGFEIAGVALIVLEIRHDRRKAQELFPPVRAERGTASISVSATGTTRSTGRAVVAKTTIEKRIEALERDRDQQQEAYFQLLQETTHATKAQMLDQIEQAAQQLAAKDAKRDEALRRFLHEQLSGGFGRRVLGVVLVLAGIFCTTAAGIWQAS